MEAEAVYDAGREAVVEVLLRMDVQIRRLEERVARQDERIGQLGRKLKWQLAQLIGVAEL